MYYLGIDPSTSSTGYAVIDKQEKLIDFGKIEGVADDPKSFAKLYQELNNLFHAYTYEGIVCEQQFLGQNPKTAIKLVRPTGVVLAAAGTLKDVDDIHFDFLMPASWRNLYRGSGKWNKKNTYEYTLKKYPDLEKAFAPYSLLKSGKVSQPRMYKNCNDMTDAIGLAHAALVLANERRTTKTD